MPIGLLVFLGLLLGFTLGLVGGGGSVLGVPILVYVSGVSVKEAIVMTLLVLAIAGLVGVWIERKSGQIHYKATMVFGLAGAVGASAGSIFTSKVRESLLLLLIAVIMVISGIAVLRSRDKSSPLNRLKVVPPCRWIRCGSIGLLVGFLTGFVGVGGGVLLVPAMTLFANLPFRIATQTSLAVITINASFGFLGHIHSKIDWHLTLGFMVAVVIGLIIGQASRSRVSVKSLRIYFASLMILIAITLMGNLLVNSFSG
jgi:uncharacterized membrane protein YfcA